MKFTLFAVQLLACGQIASAFAPAQFLQQGNLASISTARKERFQIFSSQWDEEEDDDIAIGRATFDEAGEGLKKEDDDKKMGEMGDYDANPAYNSSDIDRVREAIKQRTEALGIEKSKVSQEAIQEAQQRAQVALADKASGGEQLLDLNQISQTAPRGQDEDIPAILYNPEDEMTEEEKKEADPDGQMSISDQVMKEVSEATWPTLGAALREVVLVFGVIAFTAAAIISWDNFLRDTYTNFGFIPRPEDIMEGSDNMVLPDGWTNGMSEDDFMNFREEIGNAASSASGSADFPDL